MKMQNFIFKKEFQDGDRRAWNPKRGPWTAMAARPRSCHAAHWEQTYPYAPVSTTGPSVPTKANESPIRPALVPFSHVPFVLPGKVRWSGGSRCFFLAPNVGSAISPRGLYPVRRGNWYLGSESFLFRNPGVTASDPFRGQESGLFSSWVLQLKPHVTDLLFTCPYSAWVSPSPRTRFPLIHPDTHLLFPTPNSLHSWQ